MSQSLCKLLGKELSYLGSSRKLQTAEIGKGNIKNVIGLLFVTEGDISKERSRQLKDLRDSLVQLHGELKKRSDAGFEVVMIPMNQASCPEDPATSITQLFSQKESPFLLISSEKAGRIQEYLLRKYNIQEGPSLVLIDGSTADVILFDGKDEVMKDPNGDLFPWKYPTASEILESGHFVQNKVSVVDSQDEGIKDCSSIARVVKSDSFKTSVKGLLFAAFWCPPCRSFLTAVLDIYQRVNKNEKKLEIVFVSSDRSKESFNRFFASMPWLAIPYDDEKRREILTKMYNVKAIPNVTLLDENYSIITTEGRVEINDDLEGIEFPWYPRLVDELRDRHSTILNNSQCLIYFTDDSETDYERAEEILNPVAVNIIKSSTEEACEPKLFIAADSDIAESLRIFMDLEERHSYLVIMDAANFRFAVYSSSIKDLSETYVKGFLNQFQTNKLIYKYIQSRFV